MKNNDAVLIGKRLRELRKERNLTQADVQSELDVPGLKKYEIGLHIPTYHVLKELTAFYGVSFDDILAVDEITVSEARSNERAVPLKKQIQTLVEQSKIGKATLYHRGYKYLTCIVAESESIEMVVSLKDGSFSQQRHLEVCSEKEIHEVIAELKLLIKQLDC